MFTVADFKFWGICVRMVMSGELPACLTWLMQRPSVTRKQGSPPEYQEGFSRLLCQIAETGVDLQKTHPVVPCLIVWLDINNSATGCRLPRRCLSSGDSVTPLSSQPSCGRQWLGGILKRYPEIGDRPQKVLLNPLEGSIKPLKKVLSNPKRFYRTLFWAPKGFHRTFVRGTSEPQTGFYETFRIEPPPFRLPF